MSPRIALDNYYVIITCLIACCFALFVTLRIRQKASKSLLLSLYLQTQGYLMLWTLSKIFKTVSPTLELRWFFIVVQFFSICALGVSFLSFAYTYATEKTFTGRHTVIIAIPAVLSFIIVITNPLHMLFYKTFDMFRDTFGPLFYVHQVIIYTYLLIGIFLCSKDFMKRTSLSRITSALVAIAVLFPLIVNLLYVFKILKLVFHIRLPMDITPISCMLSYSLFYLAVLRYRFLDVTPLAYHKAMDMSCDGLAILSENDAILWQNVAFGTLSPCHSVGEAIDMSKTVLSNGRYLVRLSDRRPLEDSLKALDSRKSALKEAYSYYEKQMDDLKALHLNLALNQLARHVHDVLGHGMVMVINLLEISSLKRRTDAGNPIDSLEKAHSILEENIYHMTDSECNDIDQDDQIPLQSYLHPLTKHLEMIGVSLEVIVQGTESAISRDLANHLYSICREAVTNALRHGHADHIHIFIRWLKKGLDIHIIDNGIGCSDIIDSMGISGIRKRAALLGATLAISSEPDSGFSIHLHIPSDQFILKGINDQLRPIFESSQG